MINYHLDSAGRWRPMLVMLDANGNRVVRYVDDVPLPEEWELDQTVLPVVD